MSKKIRVYKKRRICRFAGCKHLLSIYNPEAYCYVHHHIVTARELPDRIFAGVGQEAA